MYAWKNCDWKLPGDRYGKVLIREVEVIICGLYNYYEPSDKAMR